MTTVNILACHACSKNLRSNLLKCYDSLESEHFAVSIVLCNKFLCLKHIYNIYIYIFIYLYIYIFIYIYLYLYIYSLINTSRWLLSKLKITFIYSWYLLTSCVSPWTVCCGLHNLHGCILTRRARRTGHALSMPESEKYVEFWRGNLKERTKSEDQSVNGTLLLMWSRLCWHWMDWSGWRWT